MEHPKEGRTRQALKSQWKSMAVNGSQGKVKWREIRKKGVSRVGNAKGPKQCQGKPRGREWNSVPGRPREGTPKGDDKRVN